MMKCGALLALPLLLLAAQDVPPAPLATLNIQMGGTRGEDGVYRGGSFKLVDRFDVPAAHGPRDALIAFEGPGWESDKVAYRLYLDERNVPDIYGKKLPGPVLPRIGQGKDDYHAMADWGMDIFQVNQTLGMGGIGAMRDGKVTQLGPSTIRARIHNAPGLASVEVENRGFAGAGGPADLSTSYGIAAGSRVTMVHASVTGAVPQMVAGLTLHPGVQIVEGRTGSWRYIATWGIQSLARDELGIALFYPAENVTEVGQNAGTFYVRFCNSRQIRYAFAAAWIQEPAAPKDVASFRAWLDKTAVEVGRAMASPEVRVPGAAMACTH